MDFYHILASKPHNRHYLTRYVKFINQCMYHNSTNDMGTYIEKHHICPQAKDMFPEYKSEKVHHWNICTLTPRQHYIAHWLLFRTFRTQSSAFALRSMMNGQSTRHLGRTKSRQYEIISREVKELCSNANKGKSTYYDIDGVPRKFRTDDPRVLSGELISTSLGRSSGKHTEEHKKYITELMRKRAFNPNKIKKLYFLDIRIEVLYHSTLFVELLEQGWSSNSTKEYVSAIARKNNANMSPESRKKAAESAKHTRESKEYIPRIITPEECKNRRRLNVDYRKLYFNTTTMTFEMVDPYDTTGEHILVYTSSNSRCVYTEEGKRKYSSKLVPIPPNCYDEHPETCYFVLDTENMMVKYLAYKNITTCHIKITAPFGKCIRVKFLDDTLMHHVNNTIYIATSLIEKYGMPKNCIRFSYSNVTL